MSKKEHKIEVKKIVITVGDKDLIMNVQDVRKLRDELNHLLGSCNCSHNHYPWTFTNTNVGASDTFFMNNSEATDSTNLVLKNSDTNHTSGFVSTIAETKTDTALQS